MGPNRNQRGPFVFFLAVSAIASRESGRGPRCHHHRARTLTATLLSGALFRVGFEENRQRRFRVTMVSALGQVFL